MALSYLLIMQKWRKYLALGLALCVMATSHAIAAGRVAALHQVELCIGLETVVIYLDENGDPQSAPHYCPDCALHLLAWNALDLATVELVFEPVQRSDCCLDIERGVQAQLRSKAAWPRAPPKLA